MSAGAAPPLAVDVVALPAERAAPRVTAGSLSRREAALRSAATVGVAGVALVQAIGLPSVLAGGADVAVLSIAAMALSLYAAIALATAPASMSRQVWRAVAATGALVLAGWAVPRAVALPGLAGERGAWSAMPGALCAGLAAACLAAAAVAAPPTRHGLATAVALLVAFGPGAGALLVALGPGPPGGETAITADVHVHAHSTAAEPDIRLVRGPRGNHYVTPVPRRPHPPALGIALVVAAASVFVFGAVGNLRRRAAPGPPAGVVGIDRESA